MTPKKTWQVRATTTARAARLAKRYNRSRSDIAEAALLLAEKAPEVFAAMLTAVAQLQPTQGTGRRCVAAKLRELRAQREAACATDTFEEHRATYEDMNEEELFDRRRTGADRKQ
jgi:hypothetical protein